MGLTNETYNDIAVRELYASGKQVILSLIYITDWPIIESYVSKTDLVLINMLNTCIADKCRGCKYKRNIIQEENVYRKYNCIIQKNAK